MKNTRYDYSKENPVEADSAKRRNTEFQISNVTPSTSEYPTLNLFSSTVSLFYSYFSILVYSYSSYYLNLFLTLALPSTHQRRKIREAKARDDFGSSQILRPWGEKVIVVAPLRWGRSVSASVWPVLLTVAGPLLIPLLGCEAGCVCSCAPKYCRRASCRCCRRSIGSGTTDGDGHDVIVIVVGCGRNCCCEVGDIVFRDVAEPAGGEGFVEAGAPQRLRCRPFNLVTFLELQFSRSTKIWFGIGTI
uniref:Uncharacterized protein n=1 Tax=Glossina pallidipes TaxID=7398 RepID=A0A1B0A0K5_GLOPL